jgi:hypothetical protein
MSPFQLNEKLKERCILLGASECYTQFIDIPEYQKDWPYSPFWYNAIKLGPQMHKNYVMHVCDLIDRYLEKFDFCGVTDITTDVMIKEGCRFVVYCFYCSKEDFHKKINVE